MNEREYLGKDKLIAAILTFAEECARRDPDRKTAEQFWQSWGSFQGDSGEVVPKSLEKCSDKWLYRIYKTGEAAFNDATNCELNF